MPSLAIHLDATVGGQRHYRLWIFDIQCLPGVKLIDYIAHGIRFTRMPSSLRTLPTQECIPLAIALYLQRTDCLRNSTTVAVSRWQRYRALIFHSQRIRYPAIITRYPIAMPPNVALYVWQFACQPNLGVKLIAVMIPRICHIHGALHILSDIDIRFAGMVIPPLHQLAARRRLSIQVPI